MYPFNLKIDDEKLLFVGAGKVSARKITSLLEISSPRITVISPEAVTEVVKLHDDCKLVWKKRHFLSSDLDENWRIIFACTSDSAVNRFIGNSAKERGIFVNIADNGEASTLHMPAVMRTEAATIAVYTGGKNPKLAKSIKERLKVFFN